MSKYHFCGIFSFMSDIERRGGELERYIPSGELADRQAQELALVGFSPDFPIRVRELNDALVQQGYDDSFSGFRFTLNPGEQRPKVNVEARYYFPFDVVVEADTTQNAQLSITPKGVHRSITNVRFSHLRKFLDSYPTSEGITISARKRESSHYEVTPEPITTPIADINSMEDLAKLGVTPAKFLLEAGFDTQEARLSILFGWRHHGEIADLLGIYSITAFDRAPSIENTIGSLATLLSRDAYTTEA